MTKRLAWAWVMALLLAACVAHEKAGDQAAAVGDWRAAIQSYRVALANEPDNAALKEKYEHAQREAVAEAYRKAQACAAAGNWSCAVGEADFALEVDGGNVEIAAFRANAARSLALAQISQAREESSKGQFRVAFDLIERARALSSDASVAEAAEQARKSLASEAGTEAERLRKRKAYPEAVEALTIASSIEPARRGKLDALQREYDAFRAAEYERLAREGDQALARKDWGTAETRYAAALEMLPGGRAEPLARYAGGMNLGETAMARRDFGAATAGYRQAVESGHDADGYAAQQLRLVEVRPYAVRLHSVLAHPLRPDGRPWVGRMNRQLRRILGLFSSGVLDSTTSSAGRRIIEAAMSIPAENRPTLSIQVALPDGTLLTTPTKHGLYAVFDSEFVVMTNAFDERRLSLRVVHGNGMPYEDVGTVEFPLGEIVRRHEASLHAQSITGLQLAIDPADGRFDGMFTNMYPLYDGSNLAQDYSLPTHASAGYRLRAVRTVIPPQALAHHPNGGAPRLVAEIVQAGRVVYRSPQLDNLYEGRWSISNVNLFVQPREMLQLRVWDMDPRQPFLLLDIPFSAEQLTQGTMKLVSTNGSSATVNVEPRSTWAGGAVP